MKRGSDRDGYSLHACFLYYGEFIMREVEQLEGFKEGRQYVNNIQHADNTALVVDTEEKLQSL